MTTTNSLLFLDSAEISMKYEGLAKYALGLTSNRYSSKDFYYDNFVPEPNAKAKQALAKILDSLVQSSHDPVFSNELNKFKLLISNCRMQEDAIAIINQLAHLILENEL